MIEKDDKPKRKKRRRLYSTWMDKGRLERLDWDSVAIKSEQYRLQLEPINFLPTTRAGKMANIAELMKTGILAANQAAKMFDEPDIAHANRELQAEERNADRLMEIIGDPKKPLPTPEEWHPLDLLLVKCKRYFNRAQCEIKDDDPARAEVETRYRDFGDMVQALIDLVKAKEREKQAAMAPPPMPGPPGIPGPHGPPGPMAGPPDAGMMPPPMPGPMPGNVVD